MRVDNIASGLIALALAAVFAVGVPGREAAAAPMSGLDSRPANATCLAGDRPGEIVRFEQKLTRELDRRWAFHVEQAPVDDNVWYFSQQTGFLRFIREGGPLQTALDLRSMVGDLSSANAREAGGSDQFGLVSFAFHPQFRIKPYVFVLLQGRPSGVAFTTSYVLRFTATMASGRTVFDPASMKTILTRQQRRANGNPSPPVHHFDHLEFGPDGLLYISTGDANEFPNAQNPFELRGKMLRLDVDATELSAQPYAIPPGNPFADGVRGAPEVFAYGLRNPWRFSFDGPQIYLGDVGAQGYEEINLITNGGNYGWHILEGPDCYQAATCDRSGKIPPLLAVPHAGTDPALIGGYVYRGAGVPALQGKYVFAIWPAEEVYVMETVGGVRERNVIGTLPAGQAPTEFVVDRDGELYVKSQFGALFKIVPGAGSGAVVEERLSRTGCVDPAAPGRPAPGMVPYVVNSKLWSDGAEKRRWMALPDTPQVPGAAGRTTIRVLPDGDFDFPIGTVLMKMFLYNGVPHETRLFKRHNDGEWVGYSYEWRGSDAFLVDPEDGLVKPVVTNPTTNATVSWSYPKRSDCTVCHTSGANGSLGPEIGQLNSIIRYSPTRTGNQLVTLDTIGMLEAPLPPVADLPSFPDPQAVGRVSTIQRARSYLHSNCSGCHRPANNLEPQIDLRFYVGARELDPNAAVDRMVHLPVTSMKACREDPLRGDLGLVDPKIILPRDTARSVLFQRMSSRGSGGAQMPPLSTTVVHTPAVNLMRSWINRVDVCTDVEDWDGDQVENHVDNCSGLANASQVDADDDGFGNRCDGDFNNDGATNGTDFRLLLDAKGDTGPTCSTSAALFGTPRYSLTLDINYDGRLDSRDCRIFETNLRGRAPGPRGWTVR